MRNVRLVEVLTLALSVTAAAAVIAQAPSPSAPAGQANLSIDVFDRMVTGLSKWGRWGKDDQKGAVNLITPAKRKQALAVVKDGVSVSMARTAEMVAALDNPAPVVLGRPGRGGGAGAAAAPGGAPTAPPTAPPAAAPAPARG